MSKHRLMKNTRTLFGILVLTLGVLFHTQAQDPFTNGLIAYYPFNGNANDESGNGNNGTVTAATLTVDRFGITNSAYAFDGVSSLITVPNSSSLRIAGDITVACWVNFSANLYRVRLVGKGGDCGRNYGLWFDIGAYWMFQQFPPEGGCVGCQENTASATPSLVLSKWYHMVGVRSGGFSRLYVDGMLLGDADGHPENCSATTYTGSEPLLIGAPGYSAPEQGLHFMEGSLDDIRIYNRAISSVEVAQLYALESPPILNLRKAVYLDSPNLWVGTNYQVQVSADLNTWTNHDAAFTATNSTWRSTNYWDVDDWGSLFFRLQVAP